jgi:hypothetical protein
MLSKNNSAYNKPMDKFARSEPLLKYNENSITLQIHNFNNLLEEPFSIHVLVIYVKLYFFPIIL